MNEQKKVWRRVEGEMERSKKKKRERKKEKINKKRPLIYSQ